MTTETLSLMGNSLGHRSLNVRVDAGRLQWTGVNLSSKAGESQSRAPGQASDYTLRAPDPLDSRTYDQTFYQDFGPPNQSGPQVFCPPAPPPPSRQPCCSAVRL